LKTLTGRRTENSYNIARFYDKQKNYKAAYVYYNDVLQQRPDSPEAEKSKARMEELRAKVGDDALRIGTERAQTGQTAAERRQIQAQVDTAARPDFVGPPPPPAPPPQPDQTPPEQKPMLTPPSDVAPVEPALPSQ
jgi:outer membrane protein assembly factor BamD